MTSLNIKWIIDQWCTPIFLSLLISTVMSLNPKPCFPFAQSPLILFHSSSFLCPLSLFIYLRRKAESIFRRFSELTKRPAAIKKALDMLTDVRSKVDSWTEKMPQVCMFGEKCGRDTYKGIDDCASVDMWEGGICEGRARMCVPMSMWVSERDIIGNRLMLREVDWKRKWVRGKR